MFKHNHREFIIALLFALVFLSFTSANSQLNSCEIQWSDAKQISFDSAHSNVPRLGVEGDTIHIAWFGNSRAIGGGLQYSRSTNGGESFSSQQTIVTFDSCLGLPGYMSSDGSYVYITFASPADSSPFYALSIVRSSDAGSTWSAISKLRTGVLPVLLAVRDSNVYLEFIEEGNVRRLMRSADHGTTWSSINTYQPSLAAIVPGTDRLHGIGGVDVGGRTEVGYYYSETGGQFWAGPEILSVEDLTPSSLPTLAVNEAGNLVAAWNDTGTIVIRRSINRGFSWGGQENISETRGAVYSNVATNDAFVGIVWDNDFSGTGGLRIRSSNNFAASFCSIDSPTSSTTVGEPSVRIAGNRLHLVWSEQIGTNGEIVYRRGTLTKNPDFLPPTSYALKQNYPNPFNGSTHISYHIASASHVSLSLYNTLGQRVLKLVDEDQQPERYSVEMQADNLPSGVYFYQLKTSFFRETKKMVIVR